jgi:Icc-related predicted phosphoesterase
MSDLHVDSTHFALPPTPAGPDALVIAGDIAHGHGRALSWLETHAVPIGLPIVFVLGNHELCGHDFHDLRAEDYEKIGVTLLHAGRPSVVVGGVRFVGTTLWTNFEIADDRAASTSWFNREMPDAKDIDLGMRRLRARDVAAQHGVELVAIEGVLAQPFDGPTVMVTHHAVHRLSLRDPDNVQASDGSYASDLGGVIERHKPAFWVHGHTHDFRDYMVDRTRIVCNPRGYSAEAGRFYRSLIVEV